MGNRFWQRDLECMPSSRLPAFQDDRLRQSRLISRAHDSALYRADWEKAGLSPDLIQTRSDLKRLPYLTGGLLRDAFAIHSIDDILTSGNVRFWFCTSGTTGSPKWIPYTDGDLSLCEQIMLRSAWMCGADQARLTWLSLITPAPFIADGAMHIGMFAETLGGLRNEHITALATNVDACIDLARARKPEVLFAFPSVAARMAERLSEAAMREKEQRLKEGRHAAGLDAEPATKPEVVRMRNVVKFRHGLFSGESLAPYRQAIVDQYGLEPYELYTCTEFLSFNLECSYHCGIHLWLDACIGEVIPQVELEKEENSTGYVPQARFLDEAPVGTIGEYVMTTFGEALPLVRYRTSDLIQVVGTGKCRCGRSHPRIRVLRRLDDVVNMGLIRFSVAEVEACLARVSHPGEIVNWQLMLEREGYKPKPVLVIEAPRCGAEQALLDEIRSSVFEIEVLRLGHERGIVAEPGIRLVGKIKEVRTATGKVRRVVYGKTW